jgi:hypothetical protein
MSISVLQNSIFDDGRGLSSSLSLKQEKYGILSLPRRWYPMRTPTFAEYFVGLLTMYLPGEGTV